MERYNAPKKRGRFMGVYMIGDFYIGASTHILNRIKYRWAEYLRECNYMSKNKYDPNGIGILMNRDIFFYFFEQRKNLKVTILSDNPLLENYYKEKYNIPIKNNERGFHEDPRFVKLYHNYKKSGY